MSSAHPTWEDLVSWVDDGEPRGTIASHVASCEVCAESVEWIVRTIAMLRDDFLPAPPAQVRELVLQAYQARYAGTAAAQAPAIPWVRRHPRIAFALATAAVLVLLLLVNLQRPEPSPTIAATDVRGEVTITDPDGGSRSGAVDQPLAAGELIATGATGYATVRFTGGEADVELWPNSELLIEAVEAEGGNLQSAMVECKSGRMAAAVDDGVEFVMNAYGNTLTTQGAAFEVDYYEDHSTEVIVDAGRVTISNEAGSATFDEGDEVLLWYETMPGDPLDFPLELPSEEGDH